MSYRRRLAVFPFACLIIAACSGSSGSGFELPDGSTVGPDGSIIPPRGDGGTSGKDGGTIMLGGSDGGGGGTDAPAFVGDPTTCAEALMAKSYVGCEYWPTVTANIVWSGFNFTAVVANTQAVTANVTVSGPGLSGTMAYTVPPNGLTKIYLPWVPSLKGLDVTATTSTQIMNSIKVASGAFHLISSIPVTVYQFNALEYQGTGGQPNEPWSGCPDLEGNGTCFSFSNDASVLIPVAAMTGNYRITGEHGSTLLMDGGSINITGTVDNTMVTVTTSATSSILGSAAGDIVATGANKTLTFTLNAGDVAQLVGLANDQVDLSGSLVYATNPVQVISARQCANQPDPMAACDHLESSVLPAETLGKDYVVTVPTSPHAAVIGHVVRFFGNVDDTVLTYTPSQPAGCPSTINAGEVGECAGTPDCATGTANDGSGDPDSVSCVTTTFEVTGSHEFAVSSFMLGGSAVDPSDSTEDQEGDPSMSPMVATEQYRMRYVFLAPTDYTESYADLVVPTGGSVTLDGVAVPAATPLNASWGVARVALQAGAADGAHLMVGTMPFGVQVIGYGAYTSYQYPAGLDLTEIAPPPPPPPGIK